MNVNNQVRAVFDCAAQDHSRSLNQQLLQDPVDLLNNWLEFCAVSEKKR